MKILSALVCGLLLLISSGPGYSAGAGKDASRMSAYLWAGLSERDGDIYLQGILESFAFQLYSSSDKDSKRDQQLYNKVTVCLKKDFKRIKIGLTNIVAIGGALEESFASLVWNSVVPIVCEKTNSVMTSVLPMRFVSHFSWHALSSSQKKLFVEGYLDAQWHLLSLRDEAQSRGDRDLFKQLLSDKKIEELIGVIDKQGLSPSVPIPWSLAKASGSLVKKGPGYANAIGRAEWVERLSGGLVLLWGDWVDLEAVSVVCGARWAEIKAEVPAKFRDSARDSLLEQHKCVADYVSKELLPIFFSEIRVSPSETKKAQSFLKADMIAEKTRMARAHLTSLSYMEQRQFCDGAWESASHHSRAPYFSVEEFRYGLTRLPNLVKSASSAGKILSTCKLTAPLEAWQ